MFGLSTQAAHDALVARLDLNKDGQLSIADVQKAAAAVQAELKSRQTNYFNALIISGLSFALGGFVTFSVFCKH